MHTCFLTLPRLLAVSCLVLAPLAGCGGDDSSSTPGTPDGPGGDATDSSTDGASSDAPGDSGGDTSATDTRDGNVLDTPPSDGGSCKATTDTCSDTTLSCLCCPAGGPLEKCTCSTPCDTSADCKDASRPFCDKGPGAKGICTTTDFKCCWGCE